ncbi:MAG: acetyltransferase, ribosomal protein N-acetylase [Chthonomonadales bacterium]|nr:acetyltransferase, ribosomal protein N-acetylase [Chthonomonadales bacterium]
MFHIRLLEEADAPEFIRLRLEGLQADPAAFGSSWEEEQARTPESVAPRLRAMPEGHFVVGAFQAERLIGVTGFRREEHLKARHKGFVWGVYVTAEARGKGVARALLTYVQERARSYVGLDQLFLSVSVSQTAARHLYTSLGFEVFGYEQHALKIGDTYVDEEHRVCWLIPPPTR